MAREGTTGRVTAQMCDAIGTDAAIIKRVRAGQRQYFACIIMRYEQQLRAYVVRLTGRPDDADDVVQMVFIKALNNLTTFDARRRLSPWLYRIAHNETMDWLATHHRRRTLSIDDPVVGAHTATIADDTATALDGWFAAELRGALHAAVNELPEEYATVIRMHYFDDLSYKEIAAALDKPVSSVGTLLRRAKKRLLAIVVQSGKM